MVDLEKYKKLLPKDHNLSEEQILKLRDQMEQLADIFFEMWLENKTKKP